MKLLLLTLAVLFAGVLLALYAVENPGYVLIARAPWSIEMPLTLFVPLLLAAFFLLSAALYLLVRLVRIPRDVEHWRTRRHTRQGRTAFVQGLTHLASGNWAEAETELLAGLRHSEAPLLNYLGAALAAQGQGNMEKRDEYLALAHKNAAHHELAVGMTQAYLKYQSQQLEQALAALTELRAHAPRHRQVLKLLAQIYQDLRDWAGLAELIPELRHHSVLPARELDALELRAHRELLKQPLPSGSLALLARAWNAVPKALRRQPALIEAYARHLIQQNEMNEAEALLRDALDEAWDETLAELYGHAAGPDPGAQMEAAANWLAMRPEEPKLLLTLARLAARAGETAAARGYYEKCIALHGPVEAYRELGELYEQAGEKDRALGYYRRGLEVLASDVRVSPPRPGFGVTRLRTAR